MSLFLCLPERPKSLNSSGGKAYQERISAQARVRHAGPLLIGPLYSRIIWFHKNAMAEGDVDNMAKKIHDALKGVAYLDDRSISRALAERVDASGEVEIFGSPDTFEAKEQITSMLRDTRFQDVLYIEIGEQRETGISLGPVR